MYFDFVKWVQEQYPSKPDNGDVDEETASPAFATGNRLEGRHQESEVRSDAAFIAHVKEQALIFFNKEAELSGRTTTQANREKVRKTFCGHNIRDWIELGDHWRGVKMVMDEMRKSMGGEEGILEFLDGFEKDGKPAEGEARLKEIAISIRDELGLVTTSQFQALQNSVPLAGLDGAAR